MLAALPQAHGTAEPQALDLIFIEGLRVQTVIGIHDNELHRPQPLVIDLHAGVPHADACDSDRIADTIDYSVVRERLHGLMLHHGVTLLEALAEQIAQMLIHDFGAQWVRVKVVKPNKFEDLDAVGVQIERRAGAASSRAAGGRSAQVLRWIGSGMVPAKS
ncbi:dihydroneopterin aldolase [Ideonella sp. 4Y16]|uniref:dihydroneopterin aldolase n=1 Tax=Ideonella alba TaxID=2824118 RepID=UPI001B38A199|nr:dihydroneopterin aldolase [Ideonella alba]MBQ0944785.1 dihydroneopterin aldolase [Ideonella alba]